MTYKSLFKTLQMRPSLSLLSLYETFVDSTFENSEFRGFNLNYNLEASVSPSLSGT